MSGDDAPRNYDKVLTITNIKAYIPITLDLEEHNYAHWKRMFEMHCLTWDVDGFLDGSILPKGTTDRTWLKIDNLIRMWIYNTISQNILQMVMTKDETARTLWKALDDLFQGNKDARTIQLHDDLRNIRIGDLSASAYCHRLKVIYDLLANLNDPIDERALVMHAINGLRGRFSGLGFIKHLKPLPSFADLRTMLLLEESTSDRSRLSNENTSASPTALYARGNPRNTSPHPCRISNAKVVNTEASENFYMAKHLGFHPAISWSRPRQSQQPRGQVPTGSTQPPFGSGQPPSNAPGQNFGSPFGSVFTPGQYFGFGAPFGTGYGAPLAPGFGYPGYPAATYLPQTLGPQPPPGFGPPVPQPAPQAHQFLNPAQQPAQPTQSAFTAQTHNPAQPTTLPQAFSNLSFKDNGEWYMDTGATSHLTSDAGILRTILNK